MCPIVLYLVTYNDCSSSVIAVDTCTLCVPVFITHAMNKIAAGTRSFVFLAVINTLPFLFLDNTTCGEFSLGYSSKYGRIGK